MDISDILKNFSGLDASLYGIALVLAIALRFARASIAWFDSAHSLGAAILMGFGGAALTLTQESHPWQMVVLQGFTLGVVVCAVEFALRKMADKVPWLPSENQFVKPEAPKPPDRP